MTPTTPPPSDGSDHPPRSRPNLGITAKDSAEMDLWAFDDADALEEMPVAKAPKQGIPAPRYNTDAPLKVEAPESEKKLKPLPGVLPEPPPETTRESIRVNVNPRSRPTFSSNPAKEPQKPVVRTNPNENFEDLDHWEEPEAAAPAPARTTPAPAKPAPATMPPSAFKEMPVANPPAEAPPPAVVRPPAEIEDDRDEFSTRSRTGEGTVTIALRPALNLNRIERIGLAILVLLLMALGTVFYLSTIRQIPAGSGLVEAGDFPIQGEKVEAVSAESYWREPVTTGPDADTVQRETLLIPVIEFATRGGPAVLRVFFRDENGNLAGDAVTRAVQGDQKLTISATAGFDDLGKHAAYRTGQTEPWTIEVLEAPPGDPAPSDFKRLFLMNVGSDLR